MRHCESLIQQVLGYVCLAGQAIRACSGVDVPLVDGLQGYGIGPEKARRAMSHGAGSVVERGAASRAHGDLQCTSADH